MISTIMDSPAVTWIGWAMALLILVPHVRSWWQTYMILGGIDGRLVRQMLHLCCFTGNMPILAFSLVMIGLLACIPLLGIPIPLGILAIMISIALVPLLRLTLPPTILFLAGSGERANALLFRLHLAVTPLRVVALFDPQRMGFEGQMLRLDLMRTSSENTWKSMIHRLIDIAPLFVVDTVSRTGPVRYEAFLMLAPERTGRAIFISDDKGFCPSLQAEGIDPSEYTIPVTRQDGMEEAVTHHLHVLSMQNEQTSHTQSIIPIIPENWDSLPSVLMIGLVTSLDGKFILNQARNTDKSLIALLVPLSSLDEEAAKISIEFSWDFSRNPRLVGLYFENTGLVMVRREFLLQNPELLNVSVPGVHPQKMSFEDLNRPEPISAAVHTLCIGWRQAAQQRDLEFRFMRK